MKTLIRMILVLAIVVVMGFAMVQMGQNGVIVFMVGMVDVVEFQVIKIVVCVHLRVMVMEIVLKEDLLKANLIENVVVRVDGMVYVVES